ncbi:sodium:dicarboxylate symporter [Sphingopyxis sp. H038]|uniref:dicarboxylate/amino acid:cation symporter n=1 Tax=unclassified Sphingopyxis TaxID=2614943 RepID=UPI00072FE4B8|nr:MULTISPECIES: dicarboxylate/amino acid:cation symporter [unclassified Sphingopyxis]KTE01453.1 sodium:dicarboxylate symporter [Sphingopyxis sp. H012]KTE05330.1 sodium:dicarboxylate symporter [Sphingopyxis sp. H093]KTE12621.1 sodium:dicarboxylate symporter [Sphingopyxis sp. H053]KTE24313.1 sodium:dicarboxylate symporter [Sphingopyxis sp. H080]KTE34814.1 sodium:dicarboxylate symporter [Sphingopyxis sp. H038]
MTGFLRGWFAVPLWQRVLGAMVVGVLLGLLWPAATGAIAFIGELFVRVIRMLVVPIVFISIASGVTALADPRKLGSVGARTVGLFAATTFCAVSIGMIVGLLLEPGQGAALGTATPHALGEPKSLHDQLIGIVPVNIVEALVAGDMLAIIFFSMLFGFGVILAGEPGRPMADLLQSAGQVLFQLVRIVMEITPFGVLALIAKAVADNGVAVFANIGWLAVGVAAGVILQILLVHVPLIAFVARRPVLRFYRTIIDALAVAFSTASSAATLPVALRIALEDLRIAPGVAKTVLPIGASIGKDGTAMYVGLLSIFALQAVGVEPDLPMLAIVLLTGALAAFGTAPIPSASLFMLAAVLSAAGVSPEQTALVVGFVLPFDRLLDMTRTVASASANLTITSVVARWEKAVEPEEKA